MLSINEFGEAVQDYLLKRYPEIAEIAIRPVTKNNGLVLHGMSIKKRDSNISPIIYLDSFYQQFREKEFTLDEVCNQIAMFYQQDNTPDLDLSWFSYYGQCRGKLTVKLVGIEENRELLKDAAHFEFGDLAGIYQIDLQNVFPAMGHSTITVRNEHIAMWNIPDKQVYIDAILNLYYKEEYKITGLMDIIAGAIPENAAWDFGAVEKPIMEMYMLSNHDMCNGAAGMLRMDLLQDFSEQIGKNLVILPSSLHEVILVPEDQETDMKTLLDMVTSINRDVVDKEDFLSNNVYFYDRKTHEMYQGAEKRLMQIKIPVNEKTAEKISVLGKLKENQGKIQQNEKNISEHSQDKER